MGFLALVVYTFFLFVRPHEWPILQIEETTVIRNSLIVALVLFVIHKQKNFTAPHVLLMFLMLLAIMLSHLSAGYFGGAIFFADDFLRTALIPMVLINAFTNTRTKHYLLFWLIIISGTIMVTDGHTQVNSTLGLGWTGYPVLYEGGGTIMRIRYLGYFSDPNDLGMLFVMIIPLLIMFAVKSGTFMRLVLLAWACAFFYGIYLTNSRGTLLATMAVCGVWFLRRYGWKRSLQLGVFVVPAAYVVMNQFREIDSEESSAEGRLEAWYEGYYMLLDNPLFGVGRGAFMDYHFRTAHNSFVLAFSEMGMVGVTIWTGLLVVTGWLLWQVAYKKFVPVGLELNAKMQKEVDEEARIALTMLYSGVGFVVSAFFLSRTYVPLLYFFVGMAASNYSRVRAMFPKAPPLYNYKDISQLTMKVTVGGILGIYALLKVSL